jgi:hypothetical protein
VLDDWVHEAAGTLFGRWYVPIFGIAFVWCAVRDLGWRRTAVYLVVAQIVGGLRWWRRGQPPFAGAGVAPGAAGCSLSDAAPGTLA